ncbi:MAG TPA: hypothetical protein VK816_10590 [Jatrophihabitantaceae bacterium]|jgi:hypothetical protein|nr:hypothetical protein [Jatrophihabitantaceae bacterium]
MIFAEGGRSIGIRADETTAAYFGQRLARSARSGLATPSQHARAVVELSLAQGGRNPRALLGGEFAPDPAGAQTMFEVPYGLPLLEFGDVAECRSELGKPLVAGLPSDFADAALVGLTAGPAAETLPAGLLRVDRAGICPIDSSEMTFKFVGGLLCAVLSALVQGEDPYLAAQAVMRGW